MKNLPSRSTQRWLTSATAAAAALGTCDRLIGIPVIEAAHEPGSQHARSGRQYFSYDRILGTSLDVTLEDSSGDDAGECERTVLVEIERLEKILSIYRADSEIRGVIAGGRVNSFELAEVLSAFDAWSDRTGGAVSSNLAEVISLWRQAETTGKLPEAAALTAAFAQPRALNIDALGKGYVVDRAVSVARRFAPGGMLNLGGDLRVWGRSAWMIGVADPRDPADNARPRWHFPLREAAMATSAGYARSYTIGGRRYSHLIDPRTLRPIDAGISATVIAGDCLTANALSTAAAVLGADAGAHLARTFAADHLIVDSFRDNDRRGFAAGSLNVGSLDSAATDLIPIAAAVNGAWPTGFQVAVNLVLKSPDGFRAKRPYVAVWVETRQQKIVRTLAIWGRKEKYLPDLSQWWRATRGDRAVIDAVSRATRAPGAYTLTWDGLDDSGSPVAAGEYKIWIEINREHGHHVYESATLTCGDRPQNLELRANAESEAAQIAYGPR